MDIKEFLEGKVCYDNEGAVILTHSVEQPVADIRGWGSIQNLFKDSTTGVIDNDKADKFHDQLGQFIADAINEKLSDKMYQLTEMYGGEPNVEGKVYFGEEAAIKHLADEGYFPDEEFKHHYHHKTEQGYYVIHSLTRG